MSTEVERLTIAHIPARFRAQMHRHVFDNADHEVGGVLVGTISGRTSLPRVTGVIPALEAVGEHASVTFTQEAWESVLSRQEEEFPNTQIVGWYHSHPGFGIFLSTDDLFIHQNFFDQAHQFAYVIDPIGRTEGIFGWKDGDIVPLEKVDLEPATPTGPLAVEAADAGAEATARERLSVDAPAMSPWVVDDDRAGKLTIDLEDLDDVAEPSAQLPAPAVGPTGAPLGAQAMGMAPPVLDPEAEARRARQRRTRLLAVGAGAAAFAGVCIALAVVTGSGDSGAGPGGGKGSNAEVIDQQHHALRVANDKALGQMRDAAEKTVYVPTPKPTPRPTPTPKTGVGPINTPREGPVSTPKPGPVVTPTAGPVNTPSPDDICPRGKKPPC